jgi:dihydroorotase
VMAHSPYRIFAFLNISFPGIFGFDKDVSVGEATARSMLPVHRCVRTIEENRDRIIGVKVRIGGIVTGDLGLGALELALEAANEVGLPLMTHIGGPPPSYADVVDMLRPGDILTHCYRPEPNSALGEDGKILPQIIAARERGVLFDIAHGMGAFGYDTTERALAAGFPPDLISSDVHVIAVEGPGFDLLHVMSKLLNSGLSLPQVIGMSTSRPALAIRHPELGHLGVGAPADITVLREVESDFVFEDVVGQKRQGSRLLQPEMVLLGGKEMEVSRRPFEEPFIMGHYGHGHHHHH